jgi:hypothetical protein
MIFTDEIARFKSTAESSRRRNTLSFFERYGIDRPKSEEMLNRLCPEPCDLYYVSTVPAGLAGSTSDLDVILVAPAGSSTRDLSSMLFQNGRRIGAKIVPARVVDDAIGMLRQVSSTSAQEVVVENPSPPASPLKWVDLERLINGISFTTGAYYLEALDDAAEYAVAKALETYSVQRFGAHLAAKAGLAKTAARAYSAGALTSAMDILMAACGRIQSNVKWTYQRWSAFAHATENPTVAEGKKIIGNALSACMAGRYAGAAVLGPIDEFFAHALRAGGKLGIKGLQLSADVMSRSFLPGATCLKGRHKTVVVHSPLLDNMESLDDVDGLDRLDSADARSLLALLQSGMVVTLDKRGGE